LRILILNGSRETVINDFLDYFPSDSKLIEIKLYEKNINNCEGCLSCVWNTDNMNPGICKLNDDMQLIYPTFIHSDLVILVTDIMFGGFSYELKKVIDRLLPVLFTAPLNKRGADVGHIMRYKRRPGIIGIGIQAETDKLTAAIFEEYFDRLTTLWAVPFASSITYSLNSDIAASRQLLKDAVKNWMAQS
jgi:hypothetical protein